MAPTREGRIHRRAVYDSYLASRAWRDRRRAWYAAWLTRAGTPPTCLVCDRQWSPKSGHLHHLTYVRIGDEDDADLVPLCSRDHRRLHDVLERSPSWRRLGRAQASIGIMAMLRRGQEEERQNAAQRAAS
jgi:hypothetical protein